ncbi:MAG: aspartate-semialdehyde dehydrogenase [Nitrosomonadales bacterium]|jgi:aspartate-semialdehyde dehydrogenase|nr:aspartate-semialdehyde dehydrogenase [Nitrosomonadales bacterium]MBT4182487.1 aspartate-semialdehyde dehydrogenase [Nitrosomonadales bacterium]MBT4570708.1 aspartate-semialdehyde dehydrogenase [Nitrosomonadales bacterium]MBT6014942.1 aspartate-semialdehyde dehydrogenase [Nitrosomonadales bacterium]MBT6602753.1 aspartate-semialdehyde dehydrogenase [Nitrosomonadales bacterium]
MYKVGIIGWRGMVGSVLIQRMHEENDFFNINAQFFSTSQAGESVRILKSQESILLDAFDIGALKKMDILLSCQGGDYTKKILPSLRKKNWNGHWIDAASTLRMDSDAVIVLDPINKDAIKSAIEAGNKNWVGGNCTVSLMLLAIHGLIKENLVEWVSSMTYQAASGAGAQNMKELLIQMGELSESLDKIKTNTNILDLDKEVQLIMNSDRFTKKLFSAPLAGSLIPWIDEKLESGQSREEWKGSVETNKILKSNGHKPFSVDGLCVRIGAMRSHSQALTIKLNNDYTIEKIEELIASANPWINFIPNEKEESIKNLSPAAVSGKLSIAVGRVRKLNVGENLISVFTVGDQLLWGAAEPVRRVLNILTNKTT